jgi:hypothetical protein
LLAGCCECSDEPSGSGIIELVTLLKVVAVAAAAAAVVVVNAQALGGIPFAF